MDIWDKLRETFGEAFLYPFTISDIADGDVQGRMFAPGVGIMEDPATGSANGPLVCYLSKHQILQPPVISLQGYEMGRPSQVYLDISKEENGDISKVKVGGKNV